MNLGPWDIAMLQWMINLLIALSHFLFNNFGLTIIIFTLIIRFALLPLTLRQLRATKAMTTLQPKLMELQKKYGKDKQKLAQEQMTLYKESGVSPAGCAIPMIVQFPIWIALYQAIILVLAVSPEALLNLSRYFYSWALPLASLPMNNNFLGLDLAQGNAALAVVVGITMWVQQKMVTPTTQDPRTAQQSQMMLWMMPIIFTFFSLSFPSGLALYWVVSNIFSIVVQYFVTGWGGLNFSFRRGPKESGSDRDRKLKKRLAVEEASKKLPINLLTTLKKKELMMENLEISAKTVEEATKKALTQLNVGLDEVEIIVLSQGKSGILGLGSEDARISVKLLHPLPVDNASEADIVNSAKEILGNLLTRMGVKASVNVEKTEAVVNEEDKSNPITLNIVGDDLGILIGRRGQTLDALQYLVRLMVSKLATSKTPILIDVENYKQRRYEDLRTLALNVASQVKANKSSFRLEPMPAFERRIIHLTLADDPDVVTESIGEGESRKVVVSLKNRR